MACIENGDIVYIRLKRDFAYLYVSRALEVLSNHYRGLDPTHFTTTNMSPFLRYSVPTDYYAAAIGAQGKQLVQPSGTHATRDIGNLKVDVYQRPSLSANKDDRVPFLLESAVAGPVLLGTQFRLMSLEPSLWMSRRFLAPINRENNLSYSDNTNEVVYTDAPPRIATFGPASGASYATHWWVPPSAQGGPHQWREGMPVLAEEPYSIFQVTRQSVLGVFNGNLRTLEQNVFQDTLWEFEKVPLTTAKNF